MSVTARRVVCIVTDINGYNGVQSVMTAMRTTHRTLLFPYYLRTSLTASLGTICSWNV